MENKRKKLVIRNINEESTETEYIEDTLVEKMCSCEDDVAEKKSTSESVGACRGRVLAPKKKYVKISGLRTFLGFCGFLRLVIMNEKKTKVACIYRIYCNYKRLFCFLK